MFLTSHIQENVLFGEKYARFELIGRTSAWTSWMRYWWNQ